MLFYRSYQGSFNRGKFVVKWVFSILQNTWKYSVYADNRKLDIKFIINPLVKIWSIGDAGVVNLVLIVEINARMILYNFCELVTSHAVVKTSKNTKHVYKINFATAVNICRAYLKHGGDETETMLFIQKYLTPVRYNRKYPIHLSPKRNRNFTYRVA